MQRRPLVFVGMFCGDFGPSVWSAAHRAVCLRHFGGAFCAMLGRYCEHATTTHLPYYSEQTTSTATTEGLGCARGSVVRGMGLDMKLHRQICLGFGKLSTRVGWPPDTFPGEADRSELGPGRGVCQAEPGACGERWVCCASSKTRLRRRWTARRLYGFWHQAAWSQREAITRGPGGWKRTRIGHCPRG